MKYKYGQRVITPKNEAGIVEKCEYSRNEGHLLTIKVHGGDVFSYRPRELRFID